MVRPQAKPCTGIPRLDIIHIRQPNSPNEDFIVQKKKNKKTKTKKKNRELTKICIKINAFRQLNIPYNQIAHSPNTCNACKVAEFAVTNKNGAQKQLCRHRNFNYRLIPNTFVVY